MSSEKEASPTKKRRQSGGGVAAAAATVNPIAHDLFSHTGKLKAAHDASQPYK
jgi:hypothetical protein